MSKEGGGASNHNLEERDLPLRTVRQPNASCGRLLVDFVRLYWRSIFVTLWPLVLLPVFITHNVAATRCLYVVLLMSGLWVTEALPLYVTALIPMVFFPLMGILDSDRTSLCYLKETNMMFIGGLMIAIAVEHCNLHQRVALWVILRIGCSPRKLNFGLVMVSMFVSMWISNTAAIAMMVPIIEAVLKELETQGLFDMYITKKKPEDPDFDEENPRPSKTTTCYFLSVAYAVSIGGTGSIVGSGTNLTFKGIYETRFPNSDGIDFTKWILFNGPCMLVSTLSMWLWCQYQFMGLFRPGSEEARQVKQAAQSEAIARRVIAQKYDDLGEWTWHERAVGLGFILAVLLWFFRKPEFIPGWAEGITQHAVKDATAALIVVLLLFVIPAKLDFLDAFSRDPERRPRKASPSLLTWKAVQDKLPWGLIFLLGGGFAIAEGSKASGMSSYIAMALRQIYSLPPLLLMTIFTAFTSTLTEFSSNVAIANIVLPVLAEMAVALKLHPLYLMLPSALVCSFAFMLPVGTPPNAIVSSHAHIRTKDMAIAGLGASVVTLLVIVVMFPTWGEFIYSLSQFPEWATPP